MTTIIYTLSMPNVGSWNGRWTGESNLYCIIKRYPKSSDIPEKVLSKQNYYYNFGDGWGANISCSKITGKEITKYRKASKGFQGYEWMVKEIEQLGRIKSREERQQENRLNKIMREAGAKE